MILLDHLDYSICLFQNIFCISIRDWTNQKLGAAARSNEYISNNEILAVIGLDIASSLVPMNSLDMKENTRGLDTPGMDLNINN